MPVLLVQTAQKHIQSAAVQEGVCDTLAELSLGSSATLRASEVLALAQAGARQAVQASMAAHPTSYAIHAGV